MIGWWDGSIIPPFTPSPSHAAGIPYPRTPGRGRAGEYYELRTTAKEKGAAAALANPACNMDAAGRPC